MIEIRKKKLLFRQLDLVYQEHPVGHPIPLGLRHRVHPIIKQYNQSSSFYILKVFIIFVLKASLCNTNIPH